MKNRLIITISDINGSKQYNVHEFIKHAILWVLLMVVLTATGTYFYVNMLNKKISGLNEKNRIVKQENRKLNIEKIDLQNKIKDEKEKLLSMNEKLQEIEEAIGIGPDINATFFDRVDENVKKIKETKRKNIQKLEELKAQTEKKIEIEKITALQKAFLVNGIPNGKILNYRRVSSKFGYRVHPVTKRKDFHAGLDLSASNGTPIYAPANGVVEYSDKKGAYGNFLLIAHSYGFKTAYGHLSKYAVKSGEYVSKGQVIAYVGNTGRSTGPHLHYEIRYLNKWVNPKIFINWDPKNINQITDKVTKVHWSGIFKQIQKSIDLVK
ncbi:MAG: hypothetical protein E3J96_00350 [Sulfurovum sp.]|nr:MAG: hypothetical protein E3J96_00350 [Sulfurovum sp.]